MLACTSSSAWDAHSQTAPDISFGRQEAILLALEGTLLVSHRLIPSTLRVHLEADYPVTLWLLPSRTQRVYNVSTSPTHYRKHLLLKSSGLAGLVLAGRAEVKHQSSL